MFTSSTTASESPIFWAVSNIILRFLAYCLWQFSFRSSLTVFCKDQWKVVENLGLPGPHFGVHRNQKWKFIQCTSWLTEKKKSWGAEGRELHFIITKHLYLFILIIFRYVQAALEKHIKMNQVFLIFKSSKNIYTEHYDLLTPSLGPNSCRLPVWSHHQKLFCKQAGKQHESIPLITILWQQ